MPDHPIRHLPKAGPSYPQELSQAVNNVIDRLAALEARLTALSAEIEQSTASIIQQLVAQVAGNTARIEEVNDTAQRALQLDSSTRARLNNLETQTIDLREDLDNLTERVDTLEGD